MKVLAFWVPDPELHPRELSEMVRTSPGLAELPGGGAVGGRERVAVDDEGSGAGRLGAGVRGSGV